MIKYNKLVRDKIPLIIKEKKKEFTYHIATPEEYRVKLADKLVEEAIEFKDDPSLEELADLQEVIDATIKAFGYNKKQLQTEMKNKAFARGKFKEKYILDEVSK